MADIIFGKKKKNSDISSTNDDLLYDFNIVETVVKNIFYGFDIVENSANNQADPLDGFDIIENSPKRNNRKND